MRAAWGRRPDCELLRACFVEELSPVGRRVVDELVTEKFGAIDALVARYAAAQGDEVARRRVRQCQVAAQPVMRGALVLATRGIGFVPGGRDDPAVRGIASAIALQMRQIGEPVENLTRSSLPVPLLAAVEPAARWFSLGDFDVLSWRGSTGEVRRDGDCLMSFETLSDCLGTVAAWATAHGVPLQR